MILIYAGTFGPLPSKSDLSDLGEVPVTRLISADGEELGSVHGEIRSWVSNDDNSPEMIEALLAIEDIRFHDHNGIDRRGCAYHPSATERRRRQHHHAATGKKPISKARERIQ